MARDTLTRDQIVTAAIELLDAEGLEGLNMRALGQRLGSAATAVYWHVGSKENLICLAGDEVWRDVPLPDPAAGWRDAATAMATDLHAALTRHPWLLQAFGTYPVYGPGKAARDDRLLAVFEAAGFTGAAVEQAATSLFTFVLGNALGPAASAALGRRVGRDGGAEHLRATMARAAEVASAFPRLRYRLDTPSAGYAAGPEEAFEFGLQALLDGLQAKLGRLPAPPEALDAGRQPPGRR